MTWARAGQREYVVHQPDRFDATLRLVGDEDSGVGLDCRLCDRGGAPIAYYSHPDDRTYQGTDVVITHSVTALLNAGQSHLLIAHPQ